MSSRARLGTSAAGAAWVALAWATSAWLCLAAAAAPAPLHAQQATAEEALIRHLDTLIPLVRESRRELESTKAERERLLQDRPTEPQDTLLIGPIRVVTFPDQARLAAEVVGGAWGELGGAVIESRHLREHTFVFHWSPRVRKVAVTGPVQRIEAPAWVPERVIRESAREAIGVVLALSMDGAGVGRWVKGSVRAPIHPDRVYRELLFVPSQVNRACVQGDPAACWSALGVDADPADLSRWYSDEEMPLRAAQVGAGHYWPRATRVALLQCGERGSPGALPACARFLAAVGPHVAAPLSLEARRALLWVALQEGGPGSFDRLVADPGMSPGDALLAASGLTSEELATRWRARVTAAKPTVYSGLGGTGGLAVFWFLVFGALALRSTRWRSA